MLPEEAGAREGTSVTSLWGRWDARAQLRPPPDTARVAQEKALPRLLKNHRGRLLWKLLVRKALP